MLLLMLIALALAWYSGYRTRFKSRFSARSQADKDYFVGLNYLLNDEPDESIDEFISSLEINSNTLDSHLALGSLLRRRGKVDGSIVVYQKLLANYQFTSAELNQVKLGLVKSYVTAGLLDRAEKLIDELKRADTDIQIAALNQGVTVYQLEKEWQKAIIMVQDLLKICTPAQRQGFELKASHFYCELAEKEMEFQHYNQARDYLAKATNMVGNNVRTSLIRGRLEFEQANYKQAIKALLKVPSQDLNYKAEAFGLIVASYQALGKQKKLQAYIESSLQEPLSASLLLLIVEFIKDTEGKQKARDVLFKHITESPSADLLGQAILLNESSDEAENTQRVKEGISAYLEDQPKYQCANCGFDLKKLHWLCPSCNEWGYIKPINSLKEVCI